MFKMIASVIKDHFHFGKGFPIHNGEKTLFDSKNDRGQDIIDNLDNKVKETDSKYGLKQTGDLHRTSMESVKAISNYASEILFKSCDNNPALDVHTFISCLFQPILITNNKGIVLKSNKQLDSFLQVESGYYIGRQISEILPEDTFIKIKDYFLNPINATTDNVNFEKFDTDIFPRNGAAQRVKINLMSIETNSGLHVIIYFEENNILNYN